MTIHSEDTENDTGGQSAAQATGHATDQATDQDAAKLDSGSTAERTGTSKLQVAQSVGAAMLGVQSSKNRKRDFQTGKPVHFIIGGLLGTLMFILVVWLLVQYVLATS